MKTTTPRSPAPAGIPLAALAAAAFAPATALAEVGVGDRAEEFRQVVDADGADASLREHRGEVVVMTFGASWCAPCEEELPAFEELAEEYAERDADVTFFAINADSELATGRQFMAQFDFEHAVTLYDPGQSTVRLYAPPAMPSTYIVGPRGLVRVLHEGYRPGDEDEIQAALERLL